MDRHERMVWRCALAWGVIWTLVLVFFLVDGFTHWI
jgi:hypothetical protein